MRKQRQFELQTINIQDAGQERWKRKYVYWIPALHIDGKEVAKGRWDAQNVNKALDEWEASQPSPLLASQMKDSSGGTTNPSHGSSQA